MASPISQTCMSSSLYQRSLLLLYFFSGLTSLAYEVLWARMLALQFGVSIFGVAVTVSTFMLGLGLGSVTGLSWSRRIRKPLKFFAFFEAGIAVMALSTPWLLQQLEPLLALFAANSSLPWWYTVQFLLIAIFLFIPAFFMGAGFPLVLRAMGAGSTSLGKIYGINTLGAAIGALIPLLLLPLAGWLYAMNIVAGISVLVALCAWWLDLKSRTVDDDDKAAVKQNLNSSSHLSFSHATLLAYAGIGAAAIILEVAWTRLFGMLLLRTEYVLAVILAVFLLGVGLGSLLARYMRSPIFSGLVPVLIAMFGISSLWLIPPLLASLDLSRASSLQQAILQQGAVVVLATLPVTLLLGAWLPWLNNRMGNDRASGTKLYGANAVGGAVGGVIAAFVLTPLIGTSASIVLASLAVFVLGMKWCSDKRFWLAAPILVISALPVLNMPAVNKLLPASYAASRDLAYQEDAVNITHVVEKSDGERLLLADLQRMDASSEPTAVEVQKNQTRLPLLLHQGPKSVLFLGLGTGISAAGSIAYPQLQRTAVEISQGAINAAEKWFAPLNANISKQMTIIRDDARHYLMADTRYYDVIIGDLFHPDLVGRSALLSVQQFQRAKKRLADQGLFVQWLALNQFDQESLRIVLRTFYQVFPDAVVFVDAFRLALVGAKGEINAVNVLQNLQRLPPEIQDQVTGGEGAWTWLGRYWGDLNPGPGRVQDEWAPQIEFKLPQARYDGGLDLGGLLEYLLAQRPHMQKAMLELQIPVQFKDKFEPAYAATELAHRSWLALLRQKVAEGQRLLRFAYQANPIDRWIAFAVADGVLSGLEKATIYDEKQVLQSVLKIRPDHATALKKLWLLERASGNQILASQYKQRLKTVNPFDVDL